MDNTYFECLPQSRIFYHSTAFDIFGGGGGPDYSSAAAAASAGYERAAQIQKQMYDQARTDLKPGIEAYAKTVPYLGSLLSIPGYDKIDPTATLRATPGYGFTMDQGTDALSRYAAAKGMSMSPATLKAMQTYGQGMADKTYQQYLQNLSGYMGSGQNAGAQTGQFGMNAAQGMGQAYIGQGEANANAILASGLQRQSGYGGGLANLFGMGLSLIPGIGGAASKIFGGLTGGYGGGFNESDWISGSFGGAVPW